MFKRALNYATNYRSYINSNIILTNIIADSKHFVMAARVSDELQRHVPALMVVIDIYPEIMKEMITNNFPPLSVSVMLRTGVGQKLVNKLTPKQQKLVNAIDTDGYRNLDIDLMYKICRHFGLVMEPSQNWGNKPGSKDINQGDDVERMRHHRNDIVHRPRLSLTEKENEDFFAESFQIATRIDDVIGNPLNGFKQKIHEVKHCSLSFELSNEYLGNCAEYQGTKTLNNSRQINIYLGKNLKLKIENSENETESVDCVIYVRDPKMNDPPGIVRLLEEVKDKINEGQCKIKLQNIDEGSLIIHVIVNQSLARIEFLFKEVALLFDSLFDLEYIDKNCGTFIDIVLAESDYTVIKDQKNGMEPVIDEPDFIPMTLFKMNVKVDNSAFESEQALHSEVHGFISSIFNSLSLDISNHNGSFIDVVMTENLKKKDVPSQPVGPLVISDVNKTKATLSWQPSENDGGSAITGYIIETREKWRPTYTEAGKVKPNVTTFELTGLKEDEDYLVQVKAVNLVGHSNPLESSKSFKAESPKLNQDTGFKQKCRICDKGQSVYWCYDCMRSICKTCYYRHGESDDNSRYIEQNIQDMYSLNYFFKINVKRISDIKVLHDGLLVIADFSGKQLVTCHISGKQQHSIPLLGRPCRLAVGNNYVAVTLLHPTTVVVVDVRKRQVIQHIDVNIKCKGIMYRDNQLFIGCYDKTIKVMNMLGEITHTIPVTVLPWYICGDEAGRIYYTDHEQLYCIDLKGKTLFTFTDPNMSKSEGITTDDEIHLLVLCEKSKNILRVSPDGTHSEVIITQITSSDCYQHLCFHLLSKSVVIGVGNTVYIYKKV